MIKNIFSFFSTPTLVRVNERNMNIAYEKFQQVISSVSSSTLIFQRKGVEFVKDVLSEKWEILEKILSFVFSPSTFDFLLFLFVFVIDLFMSYSFISPQ